MFSRVLSVAGLWLFFATAVSADFSSEHIAARYPDVKLDTADANRARMEGECLVGLKEISFRKTEKFSTSWISLSLFTRKVLTDQG